MLPAIRVVGLWGSPFFIAWKSVKFIGITMRITKNISEHGVNPDIISRYQQGQCGSRVLLKTLEPCLERGNRNEVTASQDRGGEGKASSWTEKYRQYQAGGPIV